jgi:hypothetical protein
MSERAGIHRLAGSFPGARPRTLLTANSLPLTLFAVAAGTRLVAFGIFYTASLMTGNGGHVDYTDPIVYDHWGWVIAQGLRQGTFININPVTLAGTYDTGFEYWVAFWYTLFGHHPEVPRVVDALLAAYVPPAIYLAGRATSLGEQVARRAAWLMALWPLTIYWSGYDLIKDPVTWVLIAVGMVALIQKELWKFVALGLAVTLALTMVRSYIAAGFLVIFLVSAALRRDWIRLGTMAAALVAGQLLLAVLAVHPPVWSLAPYTGNGQALVLQPGSTSSTSGSLGGVTRNVFHVGDQATAKVEGTGSNVSSVVHQSPGAIAARFVVGTSITLLGPRPSLHDLLHPTIDTGMYPGLLVWLPLIPFTLLGLVRGVRTRDPQVISMAALSVGLWLGLSFFYAGVFRQREMAFPPTMLFISLGLQRPWPRWWWWAYGAVIAAGVGLLGLREAGVI